MYTRQIKRNLFHGTVDGLGKVIIKFPQTYSASVHKFFADKGHAPTLYCCQEISELRSVVVMEYVDGEGICEFLEKSDTEDRRDVLRQLEEVVTASHLARFCHGDLRLTNLFVQLGSKKVCLLDFEWSGKLGTATYPFFMNHREISWPEGAKDGELITEEHDKHWLSSLNSQFLEASEA